MTSVSCWASVSTDPAVSAPVESGPIVGFVSVRSRLLSRRSTDSWPTIARLCTECRSRLTVAKTTAMRAGRVARLWRNAKRKSAYSAALWITSAGFEFAFKSVSASLRCARKTSGINQPMWKRELWRTKTVEIRDSSQMEDRTVSLLPWKCRQRLAYIICAASRLPNRQHDKIMQNVLLHVGPPTQPGTQALLKEKSLGTRLTSPSWGWGGGMGGGGGGGGGGVVALTFEYLVRTVLCPEDLLWLSQQTKPFQTTSASFPPPAMSLFCSVDC